MGIALQLLFTGLGVGSIYALVALGFVLIYRATPTVFNLVLSVSLALCPFGSEMHIGSDPLQSSSLRSLPAFRFLLQLTRFLLENLFLAHGRTPSSFIALRTNW
jgi:hypothetical protein